MRLQRECGARFFAFDGHLEQLGVFGVHITRAAGQAHGVVAVALTVAGEHAQQLERPGRRKRAVIEKVTQALVEAVGAPKENVRVWITEVPKTQWGIAGTTAKDLGR